MVRLAGTTIGAMAVAMLLWWALTPPAILVDAERVARGRLAITVREDGTTRIRERYVISSPLAGRLLRIALREGDPVKTGETLIARIEPTDPALLDARSLAEAEARVKAAEVALELTEPMVEQTEAELEFAEAELYRITNLHERGAATASQLDEIKMQVRTKRQARRIARYRRDIARFELEQAKAALLRSRPRTTKDDDSDTSPQVDLDIHSPIDGRVLHVLQKSATVVQPGTPLVEVGDPADLEIVVDVLSADAVKIQPGQEATIEQWGGESPLHGKVRRVEPSGFTKVSALGIEEQRVNVVIDLSDEYSVWQRLGDGFHVDAAITVWQADDVLRVPLSAAFRQEDKWHVFVIEGGRARLRRVELGRRNDEYAEVLSGLEPGDHVVLYPGDSIRDGSRVRLRTAEDDHAAP